MKLRIIVDKMITNWLTLSKKLGSLQEDNSERGGDTYAQKALDEILGDEWIQNTVDDIISIKKGSELAMSCLSYIQSTNATKYAYNIYKTSQGEKAQQAVYLIKHIANPISVDWIEEFLHDENVIHYGLGVLDQLLWSEQIPFDDKAELLLELAGKNSKGQLKDQIEFIQKYIKDRNSI